MILVRDVMSFLESLAPLNLAAEWDNVGLLLGERTTPVHRVLTCLTMTPPVVQEALRKRAEMIVTHHPVLFRGTKKLHDQSADGLLLLPLLRAGLAVYSAHTAFDNCMGGINDQLAAMLALQNVRPLRTRAVPQYKVIVFVPEKDLNAVSDAMFTQGAGVIGDYEQCSFRTPGTGTFFGRESTQPTVGEKGRREEAPEWRLEVVVPEAILNATLRAMIAAHSYEEPAYDVIPLRPQQLGGEGRMGELPLPIPLRELAQQVKQGLNAAAMQFVGEATRRITRVGIACGAAGEFIADAIRQGCDAFLTGEVRFHDMLTADAQNLSLLLPGHYASERPAMEGLARRLEAEFPGLEAFPSERDVDPLHTSVE